MRHDFYRLFPAFFVYELSCLGITAGAHRLWSHRSFKAKTPLRIFLVALQTLAMQVRVTYKLHIIELHAGPIFPS